MRIVSFGRIQTGRIILIVLCSVCALGGCSQVPIEDAHRVRPVKTYVVTPGDELRELSFPGKVAASKTAELAFMVSGLLVKYPVTEGLRIRKGEIIAQLRQDEFQAQFRIAESQFDRARSDLVALKAGERSEQRQRLEAQLRAAEATLANAESEYNRHAGLLRSGSISRGVYERVETAFLVAQEELKSAQQLLEKSLVARQEVIDSKEAEIRGLEARLAETRIQLEDSTLLAPYNGVVARRFVERQQSIRAKTPVVLFQDLEEIHIAVDVPEAVMTTEIRLTEAERIVAEFSGVPGRQFPVTIAEVAQIADPRTQTFNVRFAMKVPPDLNLLPGMTARVTLFYRSRPTAGKSYFVPVSAVFRDSGGEQVVWIIGPDRGVIRRPVKIGDPSGGRIEILEGLQSGDRIAVAGVSFLREGIKVRDLGDALGGN